MLKKWPILRLKGSIDLLYACKSVKSNGLIYRLFASQFHEPLVVQSTANIT